MCLYIFLYRKFRSAASILFQLKSIGAHTRIGLEIVHRISKVYNIMYIIIYIIHFTMYLYNMNCIYKYLPTVDNSNIYNYFGPRRPCQCHQTIRDRLRPGNMTLQSTVIV